jgi:hypothetical protein
LIDHADIPFREILGGHGQFTRGKQPALSLFWRQSRRPERIAQVAGRVGFGGPILVDVHDALHPQRRENVLAQKLQQRLAAGFFYNQSRNHKIGVAILPVRSRIKIQRLARPLVENLLGRDGLQHERRYIVLRPVVLVARCMGEQFANRNLLAACQVGHESRHGIVERKLPLFRE